MTPMAVSAWARHAVRAGGCFLLSQPAQNHLLARLYGIEAAPYIDADFHHHLEVLSIPQLGGASYDIPLQMGETNGRVRL